MLKKVNKHYLFFGIIILILFSFSVSDYISIYVTNIIAFFFYYFTINLPAYKSDLYFSKNRLVLIVFLYSMFFVVINKLISFYYNDNYFVFSESDALVYHEFALNMVSKSFMEGIDMVLERYQIDDLGAFLLVSLLYRIVESSLILNFFYILVGVVTASAIFRIAKNFISIKYAFLCSLTYSISSFVIWFHSSGLKESFLVMLIVLFYDFYYKYLCYKKKIYILLSVLILLTIILFRPAILFFCAASIIITILLNLKGKIQQFLLLSSALVLIIVSFSYISMVAERFLLGGTEEMLAIKEASGMVKQGSIAFTYTVNVLAGLLGPIPTFLPNTKQILSVFSIGLIYRVFLSFPFFLGIYYMIKSKQKLIYPLAIFMLMEMLALVFILEALELRKSLPHIPFIYIIAFWFLDFFDKKDTFTNRQKRRMKIVFNASSALFFLLILYWNHR